MGQEKVQAVPERHRAFSRPQRAGLEAYLARLKAPVDFARRADGAKLAVIRNLGAFLSGSAQEGLNNAAYRAIHPQLERLRFLLDGYDESPLERRQAKLSTIGALLDDLQTGVPSLAPVARTAVSETGDGRLDLSSPIRTLAGVGPRKAALLRRLGVERVGDLLWMIPWRYHDRGSITSFSGLSAGQDATVCGRLHAVEEVMTRRRVRLINGVLGDKTGTLGLRWFNQAYLRTRLSPGQTLMCTGRIKSDGLLQRWRMDNPQFEILNEEESPSLHMGRIVPVYHETRGINSRALRVLIDHVLAHAHGFETDCLPAEIVERCGLLARREAFTAVHFPPPDADLDVYHAARSAAHRRLVFEELFLLELGLAVRRHQTARTREGIAFQCVPARLEAFWAALPFAPTTAQRRVVDEVLTDMAAARPMNRLIQGDVGCGKTVVAAAAIWMAIADGYQAALMAPTELLADQHHRQIVSLLGSLGVRVGALTGDRSPRDRAEGLARLARGEMDCVVGTHALVQPDVRFARFGFAVIDEQHKFGVLQRSHLVGKGYDPDVLIMTATPIPRTLALTVYGDLDVSIVDEMPEGRRPIETRWYTERQRAAANDAIQQAIQHGHQAYVVAPRIEESDGEIRSATHVADRLHGLFSETSIGLLHGRLTRKAKDLVMEGFAGGTIRILVATTVVEVGIDVANATVMVIEHADRYGLAQLHQLRGRVGRGPHPSLCLLMSSGRVSADARERLDTMVATRDGFQLAERDLALRGPGEFLGTRQSGLPDLRAANLARDGRVVEEARREAFDLFRRDPGLNDPRHAALRNALVRTWGTRLALGVIG